MQGNIHSADAALDELYRMCEANETKSAANAGYCAIVRNEKLQSLTPARQLREANRIEELILFLGNDSLPTEEKMFIDLRLHAYRSIVYGQSFGKSLLALEALKRLKPDTPGLEFYEKEIRFLQGKQMDELRLNRREKESILNLKRYGWIAGIQYNLHLGLTGQLGYEDDKIHDGPWSTRWIGFASTKPIFGASGGVSHTGNDGILNSELSFSTGTEDHYGLGADSSLSDRILAKIRRVDLNATYAYALNEDLTAKIGLKVQDLHVTEPNLLDTSLIGPYVKVILDELDQDLRPRWGHRVAMYGYFPRYQQFGLEARAAIPISNVTHINVGSFYEEQFGKVPVYSHLRLGESFYFPGVAINRFQDRTLLGAWAELRQELSSGFAGGVFGSGSFVGDTLDESLKHRALLGGGVFMDWRWTRFPTTDARIELSRFVDETLLHVGVNQSL